MPLQAAITPSPFAEPDDRIALLQVARHRAAHRSSFDFGVESAELQKDSRSIPYGLIIRIAGGELWDRLVFISASIDEQGVGLLGHELASLAAPDRIKGFGADGT